MSVQNHPLNHSTAKNSATFLKSPRTPILAEGSGSSCYYNLPSTRSKRSCSFGLGQKSSMASRSQAPPPGSYDLPGLATLSKHIRRSFGYGRDQVVGGAIPKPSRQSSPGPGHYPAPSSLESRNVYMGVRLSSSMLVEGCLKNPGPGSYDLSETSLGKSGRYRLSSYRNPGSPSLKSRVEYERKQEVPGPGNYELKASLINAEGRYVESRHKTSHSYRFSKGQRPSMARKNDFPGPGSYPLFSEFGY
jgi:hypothetical protein